MRGIFAVFRRWKCLFFDHGTHEIPMVIGNGNFKTQAFIIWVSLKRKIIRKFERKFIENIEKQFFKNFKNDFVKISREAITAKTREAIKRIKQ